MTVCDLQSSDVNKDEDELEASTLSLFPALLFSLLPLTDDCNCSATISQRSLNKNDGHETLLLSQSDAMVLEHNEDQDV